MDIQAPENVKRPWWPESREGKKAVMFAALAVI